MSHYQSLQDSEDHFLPRLDAHGQVLVFFCPGCRFSHRIPVTTELVDTKKWEGKWEWNGSLEAPTIRPSLVLSWDYVDGTPKEVCHSIITSGKISFCNDSTHQLKGQTVDLI